MFDNIFQKYAAEEAIRRQERAESAAEQRRQKSAVLGISLGTPETPAATYTEMAAWVARHPNMVVYAVHMAVYPNGVESPHTFEFTGDNFARSQTSEQRIAEAARQAAHRPDNRPLYWKVW